MKKLFNIITNTLCVLSVMLTIWFCLSWAEVIAKNTKPSPEYNKLNMFVLFTKEAEAEVEHTQYTLYGRYYVDGNVITEDGNVWDYQTDTVSDTPTYDAMPVWVAFDDNGTKEIEDDIILGLVWDKETAIYDELEDSLSETFTVTREGNKLTVKP